MLDTIDRGQDLFRKHWDHLLVSQDSIKFLESLIMYLCRKCLAHPSRWIAGLMSGIFNLFIILEKFKILLPFLFEVLIVSCIYFLCKDEFCSKDEFSFEY